MYGSFYMFHCFHMDDWHKDQFLEKKTKKTKNKKKQNHRDYKNLLVMKVKGKYKIKERNTFCMWSILDEQIKNCLEIKSTIHSKNSDSLVLLSNQFKCMALEHTLNQQPLRPKVLWKMHPFKGAMYHGMPAISINLHQMGTHFCRHLWSTNLGLFCNFSLWSPKLGCIKVSCPTKSYYTEHITTIVWSLKTNGISWRTMAQDVFKSQVSPTW